ncbi:MAG: segregation/condensation protein A [Candidatus Pacebacteria bacterium]|nr:segregation/condensation protein A [Candidatus Paceibacterota bacterium]MCF7862875.1 segregation/condensation protein A [Candidatus Paceibacterota bacterium]
MDTDTLDNLYKVKTPIFEGPFSVLLSLVEERKLFINEVSLAEVTDSYLKYLEQKRDVHYREMSGFMVVAATLILIKSKSLLPNLSLSNEEESEIHNLADRLKLYEMYTGLSLKLKSIFGEKLIFPLAERKQIQVVFLPDEKITKENMMILVQETLNRMPKKESLPEVEVKKVISLEEMIESLTDRIQEAVKMSFREWSGKAVTKEEKVTVIVSFLAMLELVRQGLLDAVQENTFEDIVIEKQAENTSLEDVV